MEANDGWTIFHYIFAGMGKFKGEELWKRYILVCQGIMQYYGSWKNARQDVIKMSKPAENLAEILITAVGWCARLCIGVCDLP